MSARYQSIRHLLDSLADERPNVTVLRVPETAEEISFSEFRRRAGVFSRRLTDLGLEPGDRVCSVADNPVFTLEFVLGAAYGGFVAVPLNPRDPRSDECVRDCGAKAIFRSPGDPTRIPEPGNCTGDLGEDKALIVYTSGTTGSSKGAILSQRAMLAGAANTQRVHHLSAEDRILCVMPLHHVNALTCTLLPTIFSGGSVVLPRRFHAAEFWGLMRSHRCTWSALVPTMVAELVSAGKPPNWRREDLEPVRFLRCSAAPLSPALHRAFEAMFELPLIEAMGSTEAGSMIFTNPLPPAPRKIGSAGIAECFQVRIVDQAGSLCPAGEAGDILVRGASLMSGYINDPKQTARAIDAEGWLHTGDVGYFDADGYIFVSGRSKDLIIKGGENISPREIDEVLLSHPSVREAAAVGVPDRYWGQEVGAWVVPKAGAARDPLELRAYCESVLGPLRTPAWIRFVDSLPKGPTGKVLRADLAARAAAPADGVVSEQPEETAEPSPIEDEIGRIWTEHFGKTVSNRHDNFFAIGGSSLLAVRILAAIREATQVELPLSTFVDYPTIASQSAIVRERLLAQLSQSEADTLLAQTEVDEQPGR
jgi:long-chain acyl-CoA synthetase